MPAFVDPTTGKRYENVPPEDVERAQSEFGLVTPEEYDKQKKWEALTPIEKAGDYATALPQAIARGSMAPGMALQGLITGKPVTSERATPEVQARYASPGAEFQEGVFSPEAQERKERHPFIAGVGESAPSMVAGGALGALAVPAAGSLGLLPAAGGMVAESGLQGVSQEAVDSVTQKRDFSVKAAGMNGLADLAFSALTFGAGHLGGRLLNRGAAEVGSEVAESGVRAAAGAEPATPARNWIAELDPGEAPEAIGAARRQSAGGRPARSVGAMGDAAETMPAREVEHFVRHDDDIVDNMRTVAGGGPGEKGAFQEFNESFREVTNNRVKREDFVAAAPTDDVTRAALMAERDAVAESLEGVSRTLGERGAKGRAKLIDAHVSALKAAPVEEISSVLDRSKASLDDLHMRAIVDKTDPYGEVLDVVNPAVERIRSTLENPSFVGDKIAELQQVRNSAWSDKDTGFIRNMQIANETGVKLFKKIDRDYATGDLVMQFDPSAFKQLLSLDAHESKPVLEAWAKVLDSAERMGANTAEVGAKSAGTAPIDKLHESISAIRDIFTTQDKRIAAKDLARPGQELLSRAEELPGVGTAIKGAKTVFGKERVEAFAGGLGSAHVPVKERSVAKARQALAGLGGAPRVPGGAPLPANDAGPLRGALGGRGGQVAGAAALIGGGSLLASGKAGAAELLPEQQKARDGFESQLRVMPPDQQQRAIGTAESLARIQRKTEQRVQGAVTDLFSLAKDPRASPKYRSPEARQLDARAQELDVPRHLARFMGKRDDPVVAFKDKAKTINEIVRDPAALSRRMAQNLGDLPTEQPEIFASMVGQTMLVAEYLHERMPGNAGRSALDPGGYPPSFEEISEWAGHWTGAIHPLDTLDDLASNDLVPEQMEAVQALHPEGYSMFQATAMKEIHALSRKRGTIPLEALEQIDGALGLDGAGEPILSSAMADLIGQATAKEAERLQEQAKAQQPQSPMVSQSPSRLASSSLSSIHPE